MSNTGSVLFECGDRRLERAWRLAQGDLAGNIVPFRDGLLERAEPVFLAGMDYNTPWTRDAAINTWFGGGLLCDGVARATMLSVLERGETGLRIAGQYWDAIIWSWGAWELYLFTGDRAFLSLALEATANSLRRFEAEEFDAGLGLFRGAACYGDGVAAYPDVYTHPGSYGGILEWPRHNPERAAKTGYGLPMHALSTNCLYHHAYVLAGRMAAELGVAADPDWAARAAALRRSINDRFWMPEAGRYRYLVDAFGGSEHQEGLGHSFAILLGVADAEQTAQVLRNQHVTEQGIACVWPTFPRYQRAGQEHFGRHSGTVWPHVQGFWALAALEGARSDLFEFELRKLAELACRSGEFREIYHPVTGEAYGGLQEGYRKGSVTPSRHRQTWSATAFIAMVVKGLLGMKFRPEGVRFQPVPMAGIRQVKLGRLRYRQADLQVKLDLGGNTMKSFKINGAEQAEPLLPAGLEGAVDIDVATG